MESPLKTRSARGIRAIEIGSEVLHCLSDARGPIALKMVAEKTGLSASNAHFYLTSLVRTGLARQEPDTGHYALGPCALRLGLAAMEQLDAISASRHLLHALTRETGFSSFLNVWGSHGPTVVYRVDGSHRTVLEIRVGSTLPVLRSGAGRVFLAYLPQEMTRELAEAELASAVPGEARDRAKAAAGIARSVARTRAFGMARARGTVLSGYSSIAAPIRDHAGSVQTVVSLVGPIALLDDRIEGVPARLLLQMTRELSARLGWQADTSSAGPTPKTRRRGTTR